MPRPTPAQFIYGSATVVFSTFAMLLLSQTRSGLGVTVIAVAGLALGLLVAVTVPMPGTPRAGRAAAARTNRTVPVRPRSARSAVGVTLPAEPRTPAPAHAPAHTHAEPMEPRVSEHSLHG
ncbi:hypothetical protein [Streptomyces sp. ME19-01-6]|uniref:hypothetical protein n=1 Tax=Streptomyces sp. ME19-01-6 TaxID=3028686 RepID=UPI0029A18D38|nr:hypothetical protein [Streptomyces sp. ME19-01-6]MDX3233294.1 hypothetical protein [Streptomyces sp. ME19-01-6]